MEFHKFVIVKKKGIYYNFYSSVIKTNIVENYPIILKVEIKPKDIPRHLFGQIQIEIILNVLIKYRNNNLDSIMVIDNNYKKKKLSGFIESDQIAKELGALLKYFDVLCCTTMIFVNFD